MSEIQQSSELTGSQVLFSYGGRLTSPLPKSYKTYRTMRKHPTLAMARQLSIAPILAAEWSVEMRGDGNEEMKRFIEGVILPIRNHYIETSVLAGVDFGWMPYEKVFELDRDKRITLRKLKPLLQDITIPLVDERTGAFMGLRNRTIDLPLANCLLVSFRVEGTQWHGQSLLENARDSYEEWREANAGAARYDRKVAGSHFVVYYPPGTSKVDGVDTPNSQVAQTILDGLKSSGGVAVPRTAAQFVDQLNDENMGWKIELLEDRGGRQPTFIDRLKYLDACLVRSLIMPERSVLEGQYGTKAEAGEHADLALTNAELIHRHVTQYMNWHVIDQLLALNWGEDARGMIYVEPSPLSDTKTSFFRKVYETILKDPAGFVEEFGGLDTDALKDALGLPRKEQDGALEPVVPEGVDPKSTGAANARRTLDS